MQAKLKKLTGRDLRRQTLDRPLVIKTITVNRRVVAGDHGGIAYVDFTLPLISMHAASLEAYRDGGAHGL